MRAVCLALLAMTASAAHSAPRIFIASDSTAQDYPLDAYPEAGWGTMLRCAFASDVAVENHAVGGRSTRTFISEGRLADIARDIGRDDTLLVQFGHNDANREKPERYASISDYKANLRRFIATATGAGATPVLLTPVTRRSWSGQHVGSSFPDYSQAVRDLGKETGTAVIDLDALSRRWVEQAGPEPSRTLFLPDDTHFTEAGARGVAEIVAANLARLPIPIARNVLADRPALAPGVTLGGPGCERPLGEVVRRFRFAGPAQAGETFVKRGSAFAGDYGFEMADAGAFSVSLAEGQYRVTVIIGDAKQPADTMIEAEARRLMVAPVRTRAGQFVTRSFVVDVRTPALAPPPLNAPGGTNVRLNARETGSPTWDDKLTLSWRGTSPRVASLQIERVRVPTLYLFGDSTVTDQRFAPYRSWGQILPAFIAPTRAVANYAESGETLKSFMAELRLDKALATVRAGDFVLIQFGHNDQKFQWPQTYVAPATTYRSWLKTYIAEVRLHGATPVLVTPPERGNYTANGAIRPSLDEYATAMRAVAADEKVQLIDLNAASIRIYEAIGRECTARAFAQYANDTTHHGDYGAWLMAQAVAEGMRTAGGALAAFLAPDRAAFDAAHPPAPARFSPDAGPQVCTSQRP